MPGIEKLISSKRSEEPTKDKLGDFVEKYGHYNNIVKMSEKKFFEDYSKWTKKKGYHANETKAKDIYAMAKSGITTIRSDMESTKMLIKEAVGF